MTTEYVITRKGNIEDIVIQPPHDWKLYPTIRKIRIKGRKGDVLTQTVKDTAICNPGITDILQLTPLDTIPYEVETVVG